MNNSGRFNSHEKSALQLENIDTAETYFQEHFGHTLLAKNEFDRKRSHGARHVGKNMNNAAASVHDTMQALGPIIDVIKDSGVPYAGIAIGTITFVFAV